MDYIRRRRIENTIVALARQRGFDGDPYTCHLPHIGEVGRELAAETLVLDAGCYANRPEQKGFARYLARSIVLTSTWPPKQAPPMPKCRRRGL